jgi:hypothetical protein
MIEYEFLCNEENCKHEWTEELSIKAPDPEACPKCLVKGNLTRLIGGGNGKGIVERTGQELIDKVKSDAQQYAKEVYGSEQHYANVIGEGKYHELQTKMDRRSRR